MSKQKQMTAEEIAAWLKTATPAQRKKVEVFIKKLEADREQTAMETSLAKAREQARKNSQYAPRPS